MTQRAKCRGGTGIKMVAKMNIIIYIIFVSSKYTGVEDWETLLPCQNAVSIHVSPDSYTIVADGELVHMVQQQSHEAQYDCLYCTSLFSFPGHSSLPSHPEGMFCG